MSRSHPTICHSAPTFAPACSSPQLNPDPLLLMRQMQLGLCEEAKKRTARRKEKAAAVGTRIRATRCTYSQHVAPAFCFTAARLYPGFHTVPFNAEVPRQPSQVHSTKYPDILGPLPRPCCRRPTCDNVVQGTQLHSVLLCFDRKPPSPPPSPPPPSTAAHHARAAIQWQSQHASLTESAE